MKAAQTWQRTALNVILMQAAWFACVLGAARGYYLIGPAAVVVMAALHSVCSHGIAGGRGFSSPPRPFSAFFSRPP